MVSTRRKWVDGKPAERLALLPAAQERILAQEDGKDRCVKAVRGLSQAFALAVPARRGSGDPRRCGVLPSRASRTLETHSGRSQGGRGTGSRRAADHRPCCSAGRRHRHLRRGGFAEAGHLHPLGRVLGRSSGDGTPQRCRRTAAEAVERRDHHATARETWFRPAPSPSFSKGRWGATRTVLSRPRR